MDVKPVPTEDEVPAFAGMTGFRRAVQRFRRFFGVRPSE